MRNIGKIGRIVVGSGNNRTVIDVPTNRDVRHDIAGRIRRWLFPNDKAYGAARRRGERAMAHV